MLLWSATLGIQFPSLITGQSAGFGTGKSQSGCCWHSSGCSLGRAAHQPNFNGKLYFSHFIDLEMKRFNTLQHEIILYSAFLFLPLLPFPLPLSLQLSNVILGNGKWHPPLKFNCLWHHVWLPTATRQPGRDCEVQWALTNSLFLLFLPSFLSLLPTL